MADLSEMLRKVHEVLDASPATASIPKAERERVIIEALRKHGTLVPQAPAEPDEEEPEPTQTSRPILRIPEATTEPYWYEDPAQAAFLDHYIVAKRALGPAMHAALLVTGPSGVGKTQGVAVAVDRINREHGLSLTLAKFDCAVTTDPQKWIGRREVDKDGTHFYESDLMIAIQKPDTVVLFDEINRLHPTITNHVYPLLDGSRALHVSDMNVTIPVHPSVVFLATANIGVQYGGTHRFDQAFRERFGYTLERGFPPREEEIRVLTSATGCDADAASVLVDIADKTRQMADAGDLRSAISTRTLVGAAWLVASGYGERAALEFTALPLYDAGATGNLGDETDRGKVAAIIEGRTGRRR